MSQNWPVAEVDTVRRLRVMAACVKGTTYVESHFDAAPDTVWSVAGDLERELPRLLPDIKSFAFVGGDGDRLVALAKGYLGQRARFNVVLRPGYCWMQSRFLVGGLAAAPDGEGTRFAFLGGLRIPGMAAVQPAVSWAGQPFGRVVLRRLERRLDELPTPR